MYVYKEGMSEEEQKNGAYWERNMLALRLAMVTNSSREYSPGTQREYRVPGDHNSGWYYDTDNNWEGWKRVISIDRGNLCFHIPDDFDIGRLPRIEPNWDGHTTEDKWYRVADQCGIR